VFESVDHIIIAVADLDTATAAYRTLLGRAPSWRGSHPTYGTQNALFRLENTYVELLAVTSEADSPLGRILRETLADREERPFGLALGTTDLKAAVNVVRSHGLRVSDPAGGEGVDEHSGRRRTWRNAWVDPATTGGLRLLLIHHTSPSRLLPPAVNVAENVSVCLAVDHVVIFTSDLPAALRLWTDTFRVKEQWRRDLPERGTRNVGLELGGTTIECIAQATPPSTIVPDRFWGVAYRVLDCDRAAERVRAAGIEADPPRTGLARKTRVTTVRWKRTPTLLTARV
jgi:catechol 2,3-dioxygenase-like lactoylglutathione lyase family enzyme